MMLRGRCPACRSDGEVYRREDGSWGMRCGCGAPDRGPAGAVRRAAPASSGPDHPEVGPWARVRARELVLWLPRLPAAAEGPNGRRWQSRAAAAGEWLALVGRALKALPEPWPHWSAAELRYDVFLPAGRARADRDNLVVALGKPIQDALVGYGVLAGDGPDVVVRTPDVEQHRTPLWSGFVRVTVRPVRPRSGS